MPQQQCVKCKKFLKNGTKVCPHCGTVQPDDSIIEPSVPKTNKATATQDNAKQENSDKQPTTLEAILGWVVIAIVMFLFISCSNSCHSSGGSSSSSSYSDRAQELGVTTKEYRDTYNYYRYGNP